MSLANGREIELTLYECSGKQRKKKFVAAEIESMELNGCGDTLILTRGARGGYWPVAESIEEILNLMKLCGNSGEEFATVMCPECFREVGAMEKCPVCGGKLKDLNGLFIHPMEPLGFGDEFLDGGGSDGNEPI